MEKRRNDGMENIIRTENLTKIYGGNIRAIENINIEIEEGEVYGLLGPNGAGKSTTINILTTRLSPTSGKAKVAGYDIIKDSPKVRKIIGVVPQDLTADEDLTGSENLKLVSRFYDIPRLKAQERITKLLELVELDESANRYVRQYSGGMRKRLELVTGLINEPKILFLDEPTLGLDVQTRSQMWKYVREIQETLNVTIILTSHYLEEVDALADRISIIDHGKILVTDSPAQLKSNLKGDMIQLAAKNREERDLLKTYPGALEVKNDSEETGVLLKVNSSDDELPGLMKFISERNIGITRITIHKPSLDEVFLEYTGRDIREQEAEDSRKTMINMRRLRN